MPAVPVLVDALFGRRHTRRVSGCETLPACMRRLRPDTTSRSMPCQPLREALHSYLLRRKRRSDRQYILIAPFARSHNSITSRSG